MECSIRWPRLLLQLDCWSAAVCCAAAAAVGDGDPEGERTFGPNGCLCIWP
jgi:hypothetical protein